MAEKRRDILRLLGMACLLSGASLFVASCKTTGARPEEREDEEDPSAGGGSDGM